MSAQNKFNHTLYCYNQTIQRIGVVSLTHLGRLKSRQN
jgi:hypothetical protein